MSAKKTKSVDASYLADDKLANGKKDLQDKAQGWKGGSHKERHEQQKEKKSDIKRKMAKDQEKVHWKKRVGGIAAVLFLCGAGLAQFLSTIFGFMKGTGVATVDIQDTAKVKAVLFSGDPWLVYCVNNDTQSQRLPRVLEDSASTLSSNLGLSVAVLPCWDQTASGRSVAQRFKLNLKPPLSFVVANGNKPRPIQLVGISKAEDLEKRVKPALKVETYKIDTLKKWPSLCTSRRTCVVIGHKNVAQRDFAAGVFKPLLEKHRVVKVVTLDTSFWQLKLDEKVTATRSGQKGAQVFCLARDEGSAATGGNTTYSGVFLQDVEARAAGSFMKACEAREGLTPVDKAPKINARPSKPRPAPAPAPRPRPSAPAPKPKEAGNVDRVGSRETLDSEEPLFEAVEEGEDEEEGDEEGQEEEDEEEGSGDDEVEL